MDPINIPQMLAYIYHTWILWEWIVGYGFVPFPWCFLVRLIERYVNHMNREIEALEGCCGGWGVPSPENEPKFDPGKKGIVRLRFTKHSPFSGSNW